MKPTVTDNVANADSNMDADDGCTRLSGVNAVSKHTSTMPEEIDVPIICLDDDLMIDQDYKLFLDRLSDDNNLFPLFEDDRGESETRKLNINMFSNISNRSKPATEKPINNRVPQQGKRKTFGFETPVSRACRLATVRESIQRDNRLAERRKRKIAELEAAKAAPLLRNQGDIQRDNKARKISESKVEPLWDVPLVETPEVIKRDSEARKLSQSKVDTSWDVPLVRAPEVIQRDNNARKMSGSKVDTLWDVPLVRAQEVSQPDNNARRMPGSKVETLWDVPLARTKEVIQRDNRIAERRKKKVDETKAAGTSRVVPVERLHRVTESKTVDETSRTVPVTQSNKGVFVRTRKKNEEERVAVVDKDYMSYLTWLVDSFKDKTTGPDPSDIDPPISKTQKESTIVPEKDILAKSKVKLESWSDDDVDDIIEVSDSPFSDGESTPFVVSKSKNVIDLEKDSTENESSSCVFKKLLMDVLEKPYDEGELLMLSRQASMKKRVTRCRELRKGRESNYETSELGHSYLEKVSDFDKEYKRVDGDDKARLELLRGFFFYLENITHAGAFKPWLPENRKKLGHKKAMIST